MKYQVKINGIVFFIILLTCARVWADIYYVAGSGNDANHGSFTNPFKTIQYAVNQVVAGDTIYIREGTYRETIVFNKSGTESDGYITLSNYPGEVSIVDATGLAVNATTGIFVIQAKSYLRINGLILRGLKTSNADYTPAGIWVWGASHHIEISNNRIEVIENTATNGNAHGIAIYGDDPSQSIHNLLIDGNEIKRCILGWSESLVLNGNVRNFTVTNNTIHDNNNIGIDFIGHEGICSTPSLDRARDGVCAYNTIYNIDTSTNPAYNGDRGGDGIYVDGGTRIIIEGNRVYNCNIGIEIASEHAGQDTSYVTVRNNIVFKNHIMGIAMGGYDIHRGSTISCNIIGNTLYHNDILSEGNGEICLQYDTQNNTIKNNILVAHHQNLFISNNFTANTGNEVDYNLYYGPGGENAAQWQWKKNYYNGFTNWQNSSLQDAHSVFADPRLTAPESENFHIRRYSPAVGKGIQLMDALIGRYDIDKQTRIMGGKIDIGADEINSSTVNNIFLLLLN